jgi:hypothetical protein
MERVKFENPQAIFIKDALEQPEHSPIPHATIYHSLYNGIGQDTSVGPLIYLPTRYKKPDIPSKSKEECKKELGLTGKKVLVSCNRDTKIWGQGDYNFQRGYDTFHYMVAKCLDEHPDAVFLSIGERPDAPVMHKNYRPLGYLLGEEKWTTFGKQCFLVSRL